MHHGLYTEISSVLLLFQKVFFVPRIDLCIVIMSESLVFVLAIHHSSMICHSSSGHVDSYTWFFLCSMSSKKKEPQSGPLHDTLYVKGTCEKRNKSLFSRCPVGSISFHLAPLEYNTRTVFNDKFITLNTYSIGDG